MAAFLGRKETFSLLYRVGREFSLYLFIYIPSYSLLFISHTFTVGLFLSVPHTFSLLSVPVVPSFFYALFCPTVSVAYVSSVRRPYGEEHITL